MADRFIALRVGVDGTVTAETHGVLGATCLDYIAVLEDLLEAEAADSAFTADYTRTDAESGAPVRLRDTPGG